MGATTLTVEQLARHTHPYRSNSQTAQGSDDGTTMEYAKEFDTGATGNSQAHTHSLSGTSGAADSLPPYYALALIMRIA